jgi:hypothetical protein
MFLRLVGRNLNEQKKVGRMASGGEDTASGACLVNRTCVCWLFGETVRCARLEQDDRKRVEENLGQRLAKTFVFLVPACSFDEKTLKEKRGY